MKKILILILGYLALGLLHPLQAQEPKAKIHEIALFKGKKFVVDKDTTEFVKVKRREERNWEIGQPKLDLFFKDKILVKKNTRVDLRINTGMQEGKIVFSTELLESSKKTAIYEIKEDPQQLGRIQMLLEQGSLMVDWVHGKLNIMALGINSLITGTQITFYVDSTANEGMLFLEEGSVNFPEYPDLKVRPMDAVKLRRGMPPEIYVPGILGAALLIRNFTHNTFTIWKPGLPWWQKPFASVPAAATTAGTAAAVGAVSYAIIENAKKEEKKTDEDLPGPPPPPSQP